MRCESELPPFLQTAKELLLLNYFTLYFFYFSLPPSPPMWGRVLGTTTLGFYWNTPYYLHLYIFFILPSLLHNTELLLADSSRTHLLANSLLLPIPCPPRTTPIPRSSPSSQPFPQSVLQSCDETPLALSQSRPSPPIFFSYTGAPPGLPTYTWLPGILLAPPSYPENLLPSPIYYDISLGCYRAPPSHYYCTWLSVQDMWMLL